jgi:NADPH-dependent F420 reductase
MKIAVIGTGKVGQALGLGWAKSGHQVTFGTRDPQGEKVAKLLSAAGGQATAAQVREAVGAADVVVLAIPWRVTEETIKSVDDWGDKILVDCTNPVAPGLKSAVDPSSSGGECVALWARGAEVVKAFNSTGAENMAEPNYDGQPATMFLCGDSLAAKEKVGQLARDLGFETIDAGQLSGARFLEMLTLVWIYLTNQPGLNRNIAFKLLRR